MTLLLQMNLGFAWGANTSGIVAGPYIVADLAIFTPGAQPGETTFVFTPGITDSALFTPGAIDREIGQWQT